MGRLGAALLTDGHMAVVHRCSVWTFGRSQDRVAVKELNLSFHHMDI